MVPLYTSVLSPNDYGVSDIINTTVSLLLPFLTLCISDAVLRFSIEDQKNSSVAFSLGLKICLLGTVITTILIPILSSYLRLGTFAVYIPVLFFTNSISNLLIKIARGINRIKDSVIAAVIQTFSVVAFNLIFLLWLRLGITGYLLSFALGGIILIIYLSIRCRIWEYVKYVKFDKSVSEYIKYSTPLIPNTLSWWLVDSASKYILQYFVGLAAVGIFSAANKAPAIIIVLSNIFMEAWLLSVIKEYNSPDSKEYIQKAYKLYAFAMMLFSMLVIICAYPISCLLLKGEFINGWVYVPILICVPYFGGLSGFLGTIYSAEKCTNLYFISTLIGGVFSIVISCLLVEKLELYGVAISCVLGNIVIWIIRLMTTHKFVNMKLNILIEVFNLLSLSGTAVFTIYKYPGFAILCLVLFIAINYKQGCFLFKKLINIGSLYIINSRRYN